MALNVKMSRGNVRAVRCPECGADVDERCRGVRGSREANHRERVDAALLVLAAPPVVASGAGLDEQDLRDLKGSLWRLRIVSYERYRLSPVWFERRAAYLATRPTCQVCGVAPAVIVHHRRYNDLGRERDKDLVAVCGSCHTEIHELVVKRGVPLRCADVAVRDAFCGQPWDDDRVRLERGKREHQLAKRRATRQTRRALGGRRKKTKPGKAAAINRAKQADAYWQAGIQRAREEGRLP